jgi:hypothetical protein
VEAMRRDSVASLLQITPVHVSSFSLGDGWGFEKRV